MAFYVILIIGICALIFIGSIMGITAHGRIARLEAELRLLRLSLKGQETLSRIQPTQQAAPAEIKAPPEVQPEAKPEKPEPVSADLARAHREKIAERVKPSKPPKPARPKRSLEELVGAQWSVWVGGLALLVGALFLLRYTIEAGFFTPMMRVFMAALMGLIGIGLGEFLRRKDDKARVPNALKDIAENAYIPGVLTGVGIFALLGSAYAAYALYGFIGPTVAFILMGLISLGGMFLGALHGPKLASLGLAASLATPLFIHTSEPNYLALWGYLGLVAAAAIHLARRRDWVWLSLLSLFGLLGWSLLSIGAVQQSPDRWIWALFMAVTFGVILWLSDPNQDDDETGFDAGKFLSRIDHWTVLIWAIIAAGVILVGQTVEQFSTPHLFTGFVFAKLFLIVSFIRPAQKWLLIPAGLLWVGLTLGLMDYHPDAASYRMIATIAGVLMAVGILALIAHNIRQTRSVTEQIIWAVAGAAFPLLAVSIWGPDMLGHIPQAWLFLGLGLVIAATIEWLWRKGECSDWPLSLLSTGAGLALFGFAVHQFDNEGRLITYLVGILLCAGAFNARQIRSLPTGAAIFAALTAYHILIDLRLGDHVGPQIFANALWFYTALPALVCAAAAWLLGRTRVDIWSEGQKAFALAFAALFVVFQIHHFMNGGELSASRFSLEELALQVLAGLSFTLGGTLVTGRHSDNSDIRLIPFLMSGVSILTMAVFVLGVCLIKNPLFDGALVKGGFVFNSLFLAYLLPALVLGLVAYLGRKTRPGWYLALAGGLSLISWMIYITSMIRYGFQGAKVDLVNWPQDAEMYVISAAWLLTGIALLAIGIKTRRLDIRAASAVIIVLTILKTFLVDMASLEGVLRAMSFVGLGLVLIVIGRVYQRILFNQSAAKDASA